MNIVIKNMNCPCSVIYVTNFIQNLGIQHFSVVPNKITFSTIPSELQMRALEDHLDSVKLEIVREKENPLIEKMKSIITEIVNQEDPMKVNLSDILCEQLHLNYSYLSNLFTETEGKTIREFGIALRIERAKEMLMHEGLDLMEISIRLHYSSVAHLAAQFKKVTGFTSSEYKRQFSHETMREKMAG